MLKFVFISGSHKSGTSWLAHMVGGHPAIRIPRQELWLFGHPDSIGAKTASVLDDWLKLPTVSALFSSPQARRSVTNSAIRGAIRNVISTAVGDMAGVRVIGDKTPYFYSTNAAQLFDVFPDGHFLHIVRDPRDVIVSHHFHAYRLSEWRFFGDRDRAQRVADDISAAGTALLDKDATARLAADWSHAQAGAQEAKKLFGDRYMECRYEDLLSDDGPAILAQVFSMLGEPTDDADAIYEQFSFERMTKGRKAGESDPQSFFRKGIAGDWQNHFSDDMLAIVSAACGDQMRGYGYAV